MRHRILMALLFLTGLSTSVVADDSGPIRFLTERMKDDFILVKYKENSGQVWYVNSANQWQEVAPGEAKVDKPCQYSIIVYESVVGGGFNPVAGFAPGRKEMNWTLVRTIKESGESWMLKSGKFVKLKENDSASVPEKGEFKLVSSRIGNSFAIYRYHARSGRLWNLKDNGWSIMAQDKLPESDYQYLLIAYDVPQKVDGPEGAKIDVLFSLMRVDSKSGKSWNWSVAKRKFELISDSK